MSRFLLAATPSYKLVFSDDFSGSSVDTSKWNVLNNCTIGGGYSNNYFSPANAIVSGGSLKLRSTVGSTCGRAYTSAFIFTKTTYTGNAYYEVRSKFPPNAHGFWPAWWMNTSGSYPEIDIYEWLGNAPTILWQTYHEPSDPTGGVGFDQQHNPGTDWSSAYHVYGLLRQPGAALTWYVDGTQTFQLTEGQTFTVNGTDYTVSIDNQAQAPILNSAIGGWNNNTVDGSTVFPLDLTVDYVNISVQQ